MEQAVKGHMQIVYNDLLTGDSLEVSGGKGKKWSTKNRMCDMT